MNTTEPTTDQTAQLPIKLRMGVVGYRTPDFPEECVISHFTLTAPTPEALLHQAVVNAACVIAAMETEGNPDPEAYSRRITELITPYGSKRA